MSSVAQQVLFFSALAIFASVNSVKSEYTDIIEEETGCVKERISVIIY
jgi:hypothetical protein